MKTGNAAHVPGPKGLQVCGTTWRRAQTAAILCSKWRQAVAVLGRLGNALPRLQPTALLPAGKRRDAHCRPVKAPRARFGGALLPYQPGKEWCGVGAYRSMGCAGTGSAWLRGMLTTNDVLAALLATYCPDLTCFPAMPAWWACRVDAHFDWSLPY